ncbi:MAG: primosomal protein N' [SAR202 cluster bacterium]|jgi:primosomal protein N' (replication factor Y)|nr:primosomal protein N' [SAR202 cluster bacterium]
MSPEKKKYADLIVDFPGSAQETYTYSLEANHHVKIGQVVEIPFGKKSTLGIIKSVFTLPPHGSIELRNIIRSIDQTPNLSKRQLDLAEWISVRYRIGFFSVCKMFFSVGTLPKRNTVLKLNKTFVPVSNKKTHLTDREFLFLKRIFNGRSVIDKKIIRTISGIDMNLIDELMDKGVIERELIWNERIFNRKFTSYLKVVSDIIPLAKQVAVYKDTRNHKRYLFVEEFLKADKSQIPTKKLKTKYGRAAYSWATSGEDFLEVKIPEDRTKTEKKFIKDFNRCSFLKMFAGSVGEELGNTGHIKEEAIKKYILIEDRLKNRISVYKSIVDKFSSDHSVVIIFCPDLFSSSFIYQMLWENYPKKIGFLHNRVGGSYSNDLWHRVESGDIKVVIGTLYAAFLPHKKLGAIIVHDYNDEAYKRTVGKRYFDGRKIFEKLAQLNDSPLFVSTPIPDVISTKLLMNRRLISLKSGPKIRLDGFSVRKRLSSIDVTIMDMREELRQGNSSLMGQKLTEMISDVITKRKNVFIYINRVGLSNLILCNFCGTSEKCFGCNSNLVLHLSEDNDYSELICHYCGFKKVFSSKCSTCGKLLDTKTNSGIQALANEIKQKFPSTPVFRMDANAFSNVTEQWITYEKFIKSSSSIMIGTKLSFKLGSIPNVSLSAVLTVDNELNLPKISATDDVYRSILQTFLINDYRLLKSEGVVQTSNPQHYVMTSIANGSMSGFYNNEIEKRKDLRLPPFTKIVKIIVFDTVEEIAKKNASSCRETLLTQISSQKKEDINILGPIPSFPYKLKNNFRYEIIVKGSSCRKLLNDLAIPRNWIIDFDTCVST